MISNKISKYAQVMICILILGTLLLTTKPVLTSPGTRFTRERPITIQMEAKTIAGTDSSIEMVELKKNPLIQTKHEIYTVPEFEGYHGAKTWECYTAINNRASRHYKLQTLAVTDEYGFRKVDGRYTVAVGTYFHAPVGTYIDIYLDNGTMIPCVVGDIKSDAHTDEANHAFTVNSKCATEFICDPKIRNYCSGDVSETFPEWKSPASFIEVYDYNFFNDGPTDLGDQSWTAYPD